MSGFGTDNQGIIPIAKDGSSERDGFSVGGGLEASALTPPSYGTAGGNGGNRLPAGMEIIMPRIMPSRLRRLKMGRVCFPEV